MSLSARADDAATLLIEARRAGTALAAFPRPAPATLEDAYAVQRRLCDALALPVLGWKVGRIPGPLVASLAAERLAGPILRSVDVSDGTPGQARIFVGGAGAIEAEVMLRLDRVPDHLPSLADAPDYVSEIRVGFEVASSPAPDVHDLAPFGIIADIGINNGLLIGPPLARDGFDQLGVETRIDGASVGRGRACDVLDGPWGSLRFLIDLHLRGVIALAPGHWISAGAITGVHPIVPGEHATASFGPAIRIACTAVPETGLP